MLDPDGNRLLVFGGRNNMFSHPNDVMALSLPDLTWSTLATAGTAPNGRAGHSLIYDSLNHLMIPFGGDWGTYSLPEVTVSALKLDPAPEWVTLVGNRPGGRSGAAAVYDPGNDRMVLFGGYDSWTSKYLSDIYELSFASRPTWNRLMPSGGPPIARTGHTAVFDPAGNRMIVFGGMSQPGGGAFTYYNDTWALSLGPSPSWAQLLPSGTPPAAQAFHVAIYDPGHQRAVVWGSNGAFALALGGPPAWSALATTGTPPAARVYATAVYDPVAKRMLIFGGETFTVPTNEVWQLTLPVSGTPAWSQLSPAGIPPHARSESFAAYDPTGQRMLVGGGGYLDANHRIALSDTWALSLGASPAWSEIVPGGEPAVALRSAAGCFVPSREALVLIGGSGDVFGSVNPKPRPTTKLVSFDSAARTKSTPAPTRPGRDRSCGFRRYRATPPEAMWISYPCRRRDTRSRDGPGTRSASRRRSRCWSTDPSRHGPCSPHRWGFRRPQRSGAGCDPSRRIPGGARSSSRSGSPRWRECASRSSTFRAERSLASSMLGSGRARIAGRSAYRTPGSSPACTSRGSRPRARPRLDVSS